MVGELSEASAVDSADEQVCVQIIECTCIDLTATDEQEPLTVRGDGGRSEAAHGVGHEAFFDASCVVYLPDFASACRVRACANKGGFVVYRVRVHSRGITGHELISRVIAPDADAQVLLSGKENGFHVRRIYRGIVLIARGDLSADVAVDGAGLENLVRSSTGFRETDVLPVGRISKVDHVHPVGALSGAALLVESLDENVARIVAPGQVGNMFPVARNVNDTV